MNSYIQIAGSRHGPYSSGKIAQMQGQGQLPPQTVWAPEGRIPTTYLPDLRLFETILLETGGADIDRRFQNGFLIRAKHDWQPDQTKKLIN